MTFLKYLLFSLLIMPASFLSAQQDTRSLLDASKKYVKDGDYSNAVMVLNRAQQQEPDNIQVTRELAFALYLQQDYARALETIKPAIDRKDADVDVYQTAGMIYNARNDGVESERLYKKGIKRFPASGVLYNEYGELLWYRKDNSAIAQWEKGMQADPNYPGNYYNAARYYYFTTDKTWSILYGEIFVNMESYSRRTIEVKNMILNGYKKLFNDPDVKKNQNTKNEFATAYLTSMAKQASLTGMGITPESLTMIRTRFLLDWDDKYAARFPYRLFEYHRQLLRDGLFEAYNQWLFGPVQNLTAFQNWSNTHAENYNDFITFQRGRVFKIPTGQNYQVVK